MSKEEKKKTKEEKEDVSLEEQIEKLKQEVDEWKNKYYLAYADTENLKKDIEKDHQRFVKYCASGFVEKILPILDGFHMALQKEPDDPVLKNYLVGFKYIYKMLVDALQSEGVTELKPEIGDEFDEATMEAVDIVEAEEENKVCQIYQNGYKLHDRIIRHARVVVTKKPQPIEEQKEEEKQEKETSDENIAANN